jgi:hypothetical protein
MRDRKSDNRVRKQLRLEQCAWANRRTMTPSELRLWSALKARKLGVQFRREVPLLGQCIVDFCAPSVRLVVEVDGECVGCLFGRQASATAVFRHRSASSRIALVVPVCASGFGPTRTSLASIGPITYQVSLD